MTLYPWIHWFWITLFVAPSLVTGEPPSNGTADSTAEHSVQKTTVIEANTTDSSSGAYFDVENCTLTSEARNATELEGNLSAASITGITMGCVSVVGAICAVSWVVYRNRGFNRPQVLNDRCSNPDSSGYIDDASIRDNSEEMYSLDNDSFLNSLEAMTIQNYWTDTVKHTKL